MNDPHPGGDPPPLHQISTHWTLLNDRGHFVYRYAPALKAYLEALLRSTDDAEEVLQAFVVQVLERGFERASPDRGRFRFYLKTAVRRFALAWLRKQRPTVDITFLQDTLADDQGDPALVLRDHFRRCLLDAALRALEQHERASSGNLAYTVLCTIVEYPDEDGEALAQRVSVQAGRAIRPEAFRKQVSRARQRFAGLLLQQLYQTVDRDDPAAVVEELHDLGLMPYVRDYLPPPS